MSRRDRRGLYPDVIGELARAPDASANQVFERLIAAGRGWRRGDVLAAVKSLRSLPGVPMPRRGPGRPQNSRVPISGGREDGDA
jgi:hypothetical protein